MSRKTGKARLRLLSHVLRLTERHPCVRRVDSHSLPVGAGNVERTELVGCGVRAVLDDVDAVAGLDLVSHEVRVS